MQYFQGDDQDLSLTDSIVALLLYAISHENPQQQNVFLLFSPPLSSQMIPVLEQVLKRSALVCNVGRVNH